MATASMSDEGRRLFYAATPKILDRAEFDLACPPEELGPAIGCYSSWKVYVLRMQRPELAGLMEVTAAHEMLHAAYHALPAAERTQVDIWVNDFYESASDQRFRDRIAYLARTMPAWDEVVELHAMLGTEVLTLNPVLEDHYSRYFASRQHVVDVHRRTADLRDEAQRRIDALQAEIDGLRAQLDELDRQVRTDNAAIVEMDRRLGTLSRALDSKGYFSLLSARSAKVDSVVQQISRFNALVAAYNARAEEMKAVALKQSQLYESIVGKAPPTR